MPSPDAGRSIYWDGQFEEELERLQSDIRRVDEARRYLDWVLSVHPERGLPTEYPGVLSAPLKLPGKDDRLVRCSVFYIYDDERVDVLSIRAAPGQGV